MAQASGNEKKEKQPFVHCWKQNLRAWGMWYRQSPGFFASALLSAACGALAPYVTIGLSARIISELSGGRDPQRLAAWAALTVGVSALLALANGAFKRWMEYERDRLSAVRFKPLADKMMTLDYAEVDRQEIQNLYSQILQNDRWGGYGLLLVLQIFPDLCKAAVQVAGGVGFTMTLLLTDLPAGSPLAFLNSPLALFAVLAAMVASVALSALCDNKATLMLTEKVSAFTFGNRIFHYYGFVLSRDRKRAGDLRMYRQLKNIGTPRLSNRDSMPYAPGSPISKLSKGRVGLLFGLCQSLTAVMTCAVYLFVCLKAWGGAFDVGMVTQYVGAATQLFGGISHLLLALNKVRVNGSFLDTVFHFLDLPNPMYQGSLTTEKRADRNYQVEFCDVSFRYPGSDAWALRHVSVRFCIGRRLAVVGENGSGKTTFIKLLCRLYDPQEGRILLNGIDIRKYDYRDYMALFSVVFQDFQLLAQPLGANVAGAQRYDRARAEQALADAGFGARLAAMPAGLDTMLYRDFAGDGVDVSGGEAQKIAIARALYKDAPFIILDEPTAALDPIAEAEIYAKFNDIAGDKTAVFISHRLSSCQFCDEIAVFDRGKIVQKGSHAQLLADEAGKYHALWTAQAQYYVAPQKA